MEPYSGSGKSNAKLAPAFQDNDFIQMHGIEKSYGIVQALYDVSFGITEGEVHTLLGENGAGKSTLVKIIMGEEIPDAGRLVIDNQEIHSYSPENSYSMGISMVHQELAIFENLTVAENIFPSRFFTNKLGVIDWQKLEERAKESIEIFDIEIDPFQKMDSLTLAQQQIVEILRCISDNQRIILLDEPTSGLNNIETDKLMGIIDKLRKEGITFIYISHRINEVLEISDKITILRDGRYIRTFVNDENLTEDDLVNSMVGHELSGSLYSKKDFVDASGNPTLLKVEGLEKKNALDPVDFELLEGEIIGFFGLEGSGLNTVSRMIYGLEGKDAGEITFKGEKLRVVSPQEMINKKILYLNNNRKQAGLLLNSGTADNMLLPRMDDLTVLTILKNRAIADFTEKYIKMFSIVVPSIFEKPRNLSGGNQQKLMFSMCSGAEPELMIVNEPTRGIDVGAKSEIHKFILNASEQGTGFIIFGSDLPELVGLCDRIFIMKNKKIIGNIQGDEIDEEAILAMACG
jgi:ABC-type sugar transport system ATPase subunit